MSLVLTFKQAELHDAMQLVELINSTYRGESSREGWTTEADLISGLRTDMQDITSLLKSTENVIICCEENNYFIGSVLIKKCEDYADIGMFAVRPNYQMQGVGKQLLSEAEQAVAKFWSLKRCVISVIPSRKELVEYYQRRGYQRTGIKKEFPINPRLWEPKVSGLTLELLEKYL